LFNLIVEITGEKKREKEAKVTTTETFWVPAVNNEGIFGRWAFLEVDAENRNKAMQVIRNFLKSRVSESANCFLHRFQRRPTHPSTGKTGIVPGFRNDLCPARTCGD